MEFLLLVPLFLITLVIFKYFEGVQAGPTLDELYLPYHQKKFFYTKSEQVFFNILNSHLDAQRYTVFPKVRLGDFIEVDYKDWEERKWWNKIRAKHIDYLIWDLVKSEVVLAIELDGNSHDSKKMQLRDKFVNDLYEKVGLSLERIRVGSSFEDECARIAEVIHNS